MADPITLAAIAESASAAAPAIVPAAEAAAPAVVPGLVSSAAPELVGASAFGNPLVDAMATGANGFPVNASIGQTMAADPSYWDQFTKFTQQNPVLTQMGFQAGEKMLTPQQIHASPAMISQGRGQTQPVDWASAMNPYKQTMPQNKPISLL
jgi:hypothetical protein